MCARKDDWTVYRGDTGRDKVFMVSFCRERATIVGAYMYLEG